MVSDKKEKIIPYIPEEGLPDEPEFHPYRPVAPKEKVRPRDRINSSTGPIVPVRKYGVEPKPKRPVRVTPTPATGG